MSVFTPNKLFFSVSFAKFCGIAHPDLRSRSVVVYEEVFPRRTADLAEFFMDSGHERHEVILLGRTTKFLIGLRINGGGILAIEECVETGHRSIGGCEILLRAGSSDAL